MILAPDLLGVFHASAELLGESLGSLDIDENALELLTFERLKKRHDKSLHTFNFRLGVFLLFWSVCHNFSQLSKRGGNLDQFNKALGAKFSNALNRGVEQVFQWNLISALDSNEFRRGFLEVLNR